MFARRSKPFLGKGVGATQHALKVTRREVVSESEGAMW